MNRRGFLSGLIKAGVACAILPAAATYARKWVATENLVVPYWYQTTRASRLIDDKYEQFMCQLIVSNPKTTLHSYTWEAVIPVNFQLLENIDADTPQW